ncbi:TfuA-like protein [Streptomyces sp. NPDC004667]|uniref:TfuA-like protein n=1 Tax=Streptomyces sp. NPDC004667 TaxID=3154285 RepID=UPI0033B243F6
MNNASRTVVTVGPTLPRGEVLSRLPGAEVREPVAADQVLLWGLRAGDRLLIIDGLFLQTRAVRHKELLQLIDRGVEVIGCSSMGALRAAELAAYGMRGIGEVFEAYHSGAIVEDDEVALTHADEADGSTPLSWALVDLRHTLKLARERGVIAGDSADTLVRAARRLPFTARHTQQILATAAVLGCPADDLAAFRAFSLSHPTSVKREDAYLALGILKAEACAERAAEVRRQPGPETVTGLLRYQGRPVDLAVTTHLRDWTSSTVAGPGAGLRDEQVLTALALAWPGFPELLRSTAAECLLLETLPSGPGPGAGLAEQRDALAAIADIGDRSAGTLPWEPLSQALHARLDLLHLPVTAQEAGPRLALLSAAERALPWHEAAPLLATRLWRCGLRLDWMTPVMRRACSSRPWEEACSDAETVGRTTDTPESLRRSAGDLLRRWGVRDDADVVPVLARHGFGSVNEFVRAVRDHGQTVRSLLGASA